MKRPSFFQAPSAAQEPSGGGDVVDMLQQIASGEWLCDECRVAEILWQMVAAIGGQEHEGHVAPRQNIRHVVDTAADDVDVQQRAIQIFVAGKLDGLQQRSDWTDDLEAIVFQDRTDVDCDKELILDNQNALHA